MWWPPTKNKKKSDLSGMYWPAVVKADNGDTYVIQYDNGEKETVDVDNCIPHDQTVKHGKEDSVLKVINIFSLCLLSRASNFRRD